MRGIGYAIIEIIWWLVIAAIIGSIIGWILRKWFAKSALQREGDKTLQVEKSNVATLESKLEDRSVSIAKLQATMAEVNNKNASLSATLQTRSDELYTSQSRVKELSEQMKSLVATSMKFELTMGDQDARIVDLHATVNKRDEQIVVLTQDLNRSQTTAETTNNKLLELASLQSAMKTRNAKVTELEKIVLDREATILKLHTSSIDQHAREKISSKSNALAGPTVQTSAVAMVTKVASRLRGDHARVNDDLKKIYGIGPKLEKLLKSMDITSFRQVAQFTTEDVALVATALNDFPGRIERYGWVANASAEHQKEYGETITMHSNTVHGAMPELIED